MYGKTAVAAILRRARSCGFVFCFPNNILIDACAAAGADPSFANETHGGEAENIADAHRRVNNGSHKVLNIVPGGPGIENAFSSLAPAYADS